MLLRNLEPSERLNVIFPHRINLPIRTYFNLLREIPWDNLNLPSSFLQTAKMIQRQQTYKLVSSLCFLLFLNGRFSLKKKKK